LFARCAPLNDYHRRRIRMRIRLITLLLFHLTISACSAQRTTETAPETYRVLFSTSKGDFTVQVTRAWAPKGADRFYELVKSGFYDDVRFFRVIRQPRPFMAQFGISGDPATSAKWTNANLPDDPVMQSNTRGRISFATGGPNTRTTQVFINYGDNSRLDSRGFSPFGEVISGMEVVDQLYADYGEGTPNGQGPDQDRIEKEGTPYLTKGWPMLDYVKTAKIVTEK
jgi:peptidyl-prolyl cis-trans isomerase A (cyclophilin A)